MFKSSDVNAVRSQRVQLLTLLPLLVYLLAAAFMVENAYALFGFPLDDAWIHGVYARSFAWGHGLQYNAGQQEAGSTSPLWAMVSAPAHWLIPFGTPAVVLGVKFIGLLLGLSCLRSIACIGRKISGSAVAGCIAACLFALEPRFLFSSLSGMENTLLLALWLGGTAALLAERPLLSAILFGLTPVTRPEAVLALPLALPGLLLFSRRQNGRPASFAAWLLPGLPLLLWLLFCHATTGHFLPNTYYLKAHPFHLGQAEWLAAEEVFKLHALFPVLTILFGVAIVLATWFRTRQSRLGLVLLCLVLAPLAYMCGVTGTRQLLNIGYYWTRWLDPASLLLMTTACLGLGALLAPSARLIPFPAAAGRLPRMTPVICGVAVLALSIPFFTDSYVNQSNHLASDARVIELMNVRAGKWIQAHAPTNAVVGVNDAGAIRYFGHRRTIDLLGLNCAALTFRRRSMLQAMEDATCLAVFPEWWEQHVPRWPTLVTNFTAQAQFAIPFAEYTICPCPNQTNLVVFLRKPSLR